jgi:hypothetical protein
MKSLGEKPNLDSPEATEHIELLERILLLTNHRLLSKLSGSTSGKGYDLIRSEHVSPRLKINFDGAARAVTINLRQEERADCSGDNKQTLGSDYRLRIDWHIEEPG